MNHAAELTLCGWPEVCILSVAPDGSLPERTWSWSPTDSPELPEEMAGQFMTHTECRPVDGGRLLLIVAATNGVVVIDRASKAASFWASIPVAHAIEQLPGGRLAVAGSSFQDNLGDCVALFDLSAPGQVLFEDPLPMGHGVVWDQDRALLWALGEQELRAYRLEGWDTATPSLERVFDLELPERCGHELVPVPHSADLVVSTDHHVWLFDRDDRTLRPHPILGETHHVKGLTIHPETGRVAYVQADDPDWWSATLHITDPEVTWTTEGARWYKPRWISPL